MTFVRSGKHSDASSQQSTDDEKFTVISDAGLSMGTETDDSTEYSRSPEPEGMNFGKWV